MATLGVGSGAGVSTVGLVSTLGVGSGAGVATEGLASTLGVGSGVEVATEGLVPKPGGRVTPFSLAHVWGSRPCWKVEIDQLPKAREQGQVVRNDL